MASLLFNRIDFTRLVEKALLGSLVKENLKNVQTTVTTKRTIAIKVLRDKVSNLRRKQVCTLTTLFKEQLDVIRDLLAATKPARVWENEYRFYPQPSGTVLCKCGEKELTLGDHFPARNMLVITLLTRVVRRVYFQACLEKGYLWLHGPAGTGKTETATDTAAMLGHDFRRFNCSGKWDISKLIKYLNDGTAADAETVLLFDEFPRVTPDMQRACIDALAKANRFAVFTGKSPPSAALAQNYKLFVQKMEVPCLEKIVQVMLGSEGIVDCDALGTAMYECVQTCQTSCSKQLWYDFGLRTVKACVVQSGMCGRATGFANEMKVVCDTLGAKLFSAATVTDKPVVLAAVKHAFGRDPVIPKAWTDGAPKETLPTMVRDVSQTRHGVCVVGLRVETCISVIKETAGAKNVIEVNHNRYSKKFNHPDHPLVAAMRHASQTTQKVLVCVRLGSGFSGSDVLSPLHCLLDDNRKLCLETSEVIALPPNMRIIFFATDCTGWSPATVSRLGMVCGVLSPPVDWEAKYEEAQEKCVKLQEQLNNLHSNLSKLISE